MQLHTYIERQTHIMTKPHGCETNLHASDKRPEYTEAAPLNEVYGGTGSSRGPKGPGGLTQRTNQGARSGMGGAAELGGVKGRKLGELAGQTGLREKSDWRPIYMNLHQVRQALRNPR